ncbi:MAG: DUF992 domain-containing protein [Hyphomicrobiaceae bacterium]
MKMILLAAAMTTAFGIGAANAQSAKTKLGTLKCKGYGTVGLLIGSKERLDCVFTSSKGSRQKYRGSITKVGLDVGIKGKSTMVWAVFASTKRPDGRFLAGNYVGASADASIGVGGGGNLLIGGSKNSVTLQPLSVSVQTGVNLAVGVAGFTLR